MEEKDRWIYIGNVAGGWSKTLYCFFMNHLRELYSSNYWHTAHKKHRLLASVTVSMETIATLEFGLVLCFSLGCKSIIGDLPHHFYYWMPQKVNIYVYVGQCVTNSNVASITFHLTTAHGGHVFPSCSHFHPYPTHLGLLIMCRLYGFTSRRMQPLWKSGRKWALQFNVWRTAVDRPPQSLCTSNVMDTNVSPKENLSGKEKMELPKYRRRTSRDRTKWPTNISAMP